MRRVFGTSYNLILRSNSIENSKAIQIHFHSILEKEKEVAFREFCLEQTKVFLKARYAFPDASLHFREDYENIVAEYLGQNQDLQTRIDTLLIENPFFNQKSKVPRTLSLRKLRLHIPSEYDVHQGDYKDELGTLEHVVCIKYAKENPKNIWG